MDINKEYFQSKSMELETLLREYKNQYPKNVGALVRNFFPIFVISLAVIIPMMTMFAVAIFSLGLVSLLGIAPVLLIFGVILLVKNNNEKKADPAILPRIEALKQQIAPYTEYPDVKNYLEKFDQQISETDSAKKKYRKTFIWMLITFYTIILLLAVGYPIMEDNTGIAANGSTSGFLKVLDIDKKTPFLSLTPLNKQVYEGCRITSDTVHFYILDIGSTALKLDEINFENAADDDIFRLVITDKDGVPVAGCGKFVFKPTIGHVTVIISEDFCPEIRENRAKIETSPNKFKSLETCRYLRAHEKDLRFFVEKIN